MRIAIFVGLLSLAAAATASDESGFKPIFDGKTLTGWDGDPKLWKVEDGTIAGSTVGVEIKQNTFLVYKPKTFGDFILRAEVKLKGGNSGIQFRSEALPDWVVRGYQADMAEGNWWGSIYDERGTRGVMVNGWKGKAETVVRSGDWNDVEIHCQGDHIQVRVNGLLTAELHDSAKLDGVIALQLHRGPPMQAWFRNIRVRELK
jgi:hypothetical protein